MSSSAAAVLATKDALTTSRPMWQTRRLQGVSNGKGLATVLFES